MKKVLPVLAILLALLLCFSSCSGCNQKNNESEAPTSEPVGETTQAPTEAPTEKPTDEPTDEPSQIDQEFVDKAADMIYEFYKPGKVNTVSADFTLPSSVKYRGEDVTIQWEVVEGAEYADIANVGKRAERI